MPLSDLLRNKTFRTLVEVQAVLDDRDEVLNKSPMTRSPYQVLAIAMLWLVTSEESKPKIIKQLNDIIQHHLGESQIIKVTDLNQLANEIDWKAHAKELNMSSESFLKLTLTKEVAEKLKLAFEKLGVTDFLTNIIKIDTKKVLVVTTTIQHKYLWAETFGDSSKRFWTVPSEAYEFSDDLIKELEGIKHEMSVKGLDKFHKDLGAFQVSANKWKIYATEKVKDSYHVSIAHGMLPELKAALAENTKINLGLYSVFIGATLEGDFLIESVIVELEGSSYFNKEGAGVMQEQRVICEGCCGPSYKGMEQEYTSFTIKIGHLYALFVDSLIAINYDGSPKESVSANKPLILLKGVALEGGEKESFVRQGLEDWMPGFPERVKTVVDIYPHPISHRDVMASLCAIQPPLMGSVRDVSLFAPLKAPAASGSAEPDVLEESTAKRFH